VGAAVAAGGPHALPLPYTCFLAVFIFEKQNRCMRRVFGMAAAGAAVAAIALAQAGAAGVGSLGSFFFGPKLVRAEIITSEGGTLHDYRVDQGRVQRVAGGNLTLIEKDGTVVSVPIAATAAVSLGNSSVPLTRLRRGYTATTVRDGGAPAAIVVAHR